METAVVCFDGTLVDICTIDTITTKSILAATIVGPLSVFTDCMEAAVVFFDGTLVNISTVDSISTKSILAATVEGSFSVVTDCIETAAVCFDGTLVDIFFALFPLVTSSALTEILFVRISVEAN